MHADRMPPLLLLTIFVLQAAAAADGFLDDCPVDTYQRIGDELVVDTLEGFYRDLTFVRASTASRQARDYDRMSREVQRGFDAEPASEDGLDRIFGIVFQLLRDNRFTDAGNVLYHTRTRDSLGGGWKLNYFKYLQAEVDRLFGAHKEASSNILLAFLARQESPGVPVDDLTRLDGLIALQKVSLFNRDVDDLYGLRQSPDYRLLSLVHLMFKHDLGPLSEIRPAVSSRLFDTAPSISGAAAHGGRVEPRRLEPHLDDFEGQSLAAGSVEGVLCEFARKLAILGASSADPVAAWDDEYGAVLGQLRQLDPRFASTLGARVVANAAGARFERALLNVHALWRTTLSSPAYDATKEMFISYFKVELSRRSPSANCNAWTLLNLLEDLDTVKAIRQTRPGVSAGKLLELEGRVVFLWLRCFRRRVAVAYELDGTEDERQLEAKRAAFGTGHRIIPRP